MPQSGKKHPHGRGEDSPPEPVTFHAEETPPRAWGRHEGCYRAVQHGRNTPTGVGKTYPKGSRLHMSQKHPHGRGEDAPSHNSVSPPVETPPRAWGRQREIIEFFTDNPNRIAAYPFPKPVASQKWLLSAGADRPGRTVCTPEPLECVET